MPRYPEPIHSNVVQAEGLGHKVVSQGCGLFRCTQCDTRDYLDNESGILPGRFAEKCSPWSALMGKRTGEMED